MLFSIDRVIIADRIVQVERYGKIRGLHEIRFWIDYYMQDMWMRKKLKKMNDPNVDFTQEEAHQQKRMLKYAKEGIS